MLWVWLAMALGVRGFLDWEKLSQIFYPMRLHKLNATYFVVVGRNSNSISTSLINTKGEVGNLHAFQIDKLSRVCDSVLGENGELVVIGQRRALEDIVIFVAKFDSYRLKLVWMQSYARNYSSTYLGISLRVSRWKEPKRYVFSEERPNSHGYNLIEIDGDGGQIVWENEFTHYGYGSVLGETKRGEDIVYSVFYINKTSDIYSSQIFRLDSGRNTTSITQLECIMIHNIAETDNGFVAVGAEGYSIRSVAQNFHSIVLKLNNDMSLRWKVRISNMTENFYSTIFESLNGNYVLAISPGYCRSDRVIVAEVLNKGTIGWRMTLPEAVTSGISMIELKFRKYILLFLNFDHNERDIMKLTVPEDAELLPYDDLSDYKPCPLGYYWNITKCVACLPFCEYCHQSSVCFRCAHGYIQTSPRNSSCVRNHTATVPPVTKPAPCNCDLPPTQIPAECRSRCAPPVCELCESTISTAKAGSCVCPDVSVDNGTHCVRTTNHSCPDLCETCTMGAPNSWYEIYCVKCAQIPNVITYRTSRHVVDCQCRVGYTFNGSACHVPRRDNSTLDATVVSGPERLDAALMWGGVLTLLCVCGIVAAVLIRRRQKRTRERSLSEDTGLKSAGQQSTITGGAGEKSVATELGEVKERK